MYRMLKWNSKIASSWQENEEVDDDMMIDKWTGEVLGSQVDYTCYKGKF